MIAQESKQHGNLKRMGREWAEIAVRHQCQPTTTGNLVHDQACAEAFLRFTGKPPEWYTSERFGPIYAAGWPAGARPYAS